MDEYTPARPNDSGPSSWDTPHPRSLAFVRLTRWSRLSLDITSYRKPSLISSPQSGLDTLLQPRITLYALTLARPRPLPGRELPED